VLGDEVDAEGLANVTKMGAARCTQPIANTTKTGLKIRSELNLSPLLSHGHRGRQAEMANMKRDASWNYGVMPRNEDVER
jgi:hypothetical protein